MAAKASRSAAARYCARPQAPRNRERTLTIAILCATAETAAKCAISGGGSEAGVSRSTFYAHYSDKNDLFLSDVEDFLQKCSTTLDRHGASTKRLAPVQEFFSYIREWHHFYTALVKSGKANDVRTLAQGFFARSIEERWKAASVEIDPVRRAARAHALAGSLFALLDWWIDRGMKATSLEMDDLFHQMAWSGNAPFMS